MYNLKINSTNQKCFFCLPVCKSFQIIRPWNLTNSYIERCFTIVSDDESFLDLEHKFISKILASSNLLITSEIEVLKVANSWLNHNSKERSQYAEDLLLKVRLYLLSTESIRHILNDLTFTKIESCVELLSKNFRLQR